MNGVSMVRIYAMRVLYLMIFVMLGLDVWPAIVSPKTPHGLVSGVAYSFWGALSLLAAVGLRYPLQMVPLLLTQLVYKTIWLLAVALPLWNGGRWDARAAEMTTAFVVGVVLDLLVIPWGFVFAEFVRKPGHRWKITRSPRSVVHDPVIRS